MNNLTPKRFSFVGINMAMISPLSGSFKFYKLRELWWIYNYNKDESNKDALFSFLKLCPTLEQLFVTVSFLLGA